MNGVDDNFFSAAEFGPTITRMEHNSKQRTGHRRATVGLALASMAIVSFSVACPASSGEFECTGASCVCPASGDCHLECLGTCDLQCAGSGNCEFICGADCAVACTGSGMCLAEVGAQGVVACTGSGVCDVACAGDCSVSCPGANTCIVRCAPGVSCNLTDCSGATVTCANGITVCNGTCP